MKAIQYYTKYHDSLFAVDDEARDAAIRRLIRDFNDELGRIQRDRNIRNGASMTGAVSELNDKWNAVCSLFEKKDGASPLRENGYKLYARSKSPTLNLLYASLHRWGRRGSDSVVPTETATPTTQTAKPVEDITPERTEPVTLEAPVEVTAQTTVKVTPEKPARKDGILAFIKRLFGLAN